MKSGIATVIEGRETPQSHFSQHFNRIILKNLLEMADAHGNCYRRAQPFPRSGAAVAKSEFHLTAGFLLQRGRR